MGNLGKFAHPPMGPMLLTNLPLQVGPSHTWPSPVETDTNCGSHEVSNLLLKAKGGEFPTVVTTKYLPGSQELAGKMSAAVIRRTGSKGSSQEALNCGDD